MDSLIFADWPAPKNIRACTTTRLNEHGTSKPPYNQFNLGDHVGENPEHTTSNRQWLKKKLQLQEEPFWIQQTHSTIAIEATLQNRNKEADASYTHRPHHTCVVLTADCLPILLCNRQGTHVAAIHAGWRGLAHGIIESTLQSLRLPPEDLLIWLGPAISQQHYEVGDEVKESFLAIMPDAEHAFIPSSNQRWMANLYQLARLRLQKQGITQIFGGQLCTFNDQNLFYSYRRDGAKTGRMASLIWIENTHTNTPL